MIIFLLILTVLLPMISRTRNGYDGSRTVGDGYTLWSQTPDLTMTTETYYFYAYIA